MRRLIETERSGVVTREEWMQYALKIKRQRGVRNFDFFLDFLETNQERQDIDARTF